MLELLAAVDDFGAFAAYMAGETSNAASGRRFRGRGRRRVAHRFPQLAVVEPRNRRKTQIPSQNLPFAQEDASLSPVGFSQIYHYWTYVHFFQGDEKAIGGNGDCLLSPVGFKGNPSPDIFSQVQGRSARKEPFPLGWLGPLFGFCRLKPKARSPEVMGKSGWVVKFDGHF